MATEHGLFIPDLEYLVDLTGFLNYLTEKVIIFLFLFGASVLTRPFVNLGVEALSVFLLQARKAICYTRGCSGSYGTSLF
jgi:hypothetical protein